MKIIPMLKNPIAILQNAISGLVRLVASVRDSHDYWIPLEHLESRVLLVATHEAIWNGGNTEWGADATKWLYPNALDTYHNIGHVPNNTDTDIFNVTIGGAAASAPAITLDADYAVNKLTIHGNTKAVLKPNGDRMLDVTEKIIMDQVAGVESKLVIDGDEVVFDPQQPGAVNTADSSIGIGTHAFSTGDQIR